MGDSLGYKFQTQREGNTPPKEWYYFSTVKKRNKFKGILITVRSFAHEMVCMHVKSEQPIITSLADNYNYGEPFKDKIWGFGNSVKTRRIDKEWYQYEILYTATNLHGISLNLYILSILLNIIDSIEYQGQINQLATLDFVGLTSVAAGRGLVMTISPEVRNWVRNYLDEPSCVQIRETMKAAEMILSNREYSYKIYNFNMWVDDDRFGLSVPGDCACIGVDGFCAGKEHNRCYRLNPHNMDNIFQQLSIFAGLAELLSLVRGRLIH